jgi:hypothetical protein
MAGCSGGMLRLVGHVAEGEPARRIYVPKLQTCHLCMQFPPLETRNHSTLACICTSQE